MTLIKMHKFNLSGHVTFPSSVIFLSYICISMIRFDKTKGQRMRHNQTFKVYAGPFLDFGYMLTNLGIFGWPYNKLDIFTVFSNCVSAILGVTNISPWADLSSLSPAWGRFSDWSILLQWLHLPLEKIWSRG